MSDDAKNAEPLKLLSCCAVCGEPQLTSTGVNK